MVVINADKVQSIYTKKARFYEWLFIDLIGWGRKLETFFRGSNYLRSNMKVMDAGCGTGIATRILYNLTREKNLQNITFHAFDLTPAMLDLFRKWMIKENMPDIELRQADVLRLDNLPSDWKEYDLVVSAGMLEYIAKHNLKNSLINLEAIMKNGATLLVFISEQNLFMKWFVEKWWKANIFTKTEIQGVFQEAGFEKLRIMPLSTHWYNSTIVVEAKK
ncbi:MAG: class I SAM-dependent methyltransferase [Candidatus Sungbacteria bacterium]|nr:class I SAM-dependent methyltransferase [Candidatus Sungbacteria bacterium]